MSMSAIALGFSVASVAYSYTQAQKQKKAAKAQQAKLEADMDKQRGVDANFEGEAQPLFAVYGRAKIGGTIVHYKLSDNYTVAYPNVANFTRLTDEQFLEHWYNYWYAVTDAQGVVTYPNRSSVISWVVPACEKYTHSAFGSIPLNAGLSSVLAAIANLQARSSYLQYATELQFSYYASLANSTDSIALFGNLNSDQGGSKKEFLFIQQALAHGGLHKTWDVDVDDKPFDEEKLQYGLRLHIYNQGSHVDELMLANDSTRNNARFSNVAYFTGAFKLNREEPQYSDLPRVQLYVEGFRLYNIIKSGDTYSLSTGKIYTNNSALVLLDYLLSTAYGRGVVLADIDLASFWHAARVCDTPVKQNVDRKGRLWDAKEAVGYSKNLYLYEFNGALDSGRASRDNIQEILSSMPGASLVWSDGKYRLNLPYAFLPMTGHTYQPYDVLQITDNTYTPPRNRLFRCLNTTSNNDPLVDTVNWVEDVIPLHFRNIGDHDLIADSEVQISWPDSSSKFNFCTVTFKNEEDDFKDDTAHWPNKEVPTGQQNIYQEFLAEDNQLSLTTDVSATGCTTKEHALALAEQTVRASRGTIGYTFKGTSKFFLLDVGDLIGFSSEYYGIPYQILRIDAMQAEEGGLVSITASTFDANFLAWNVENTVYVAPPDVYEDRFLANPKNVTMSLGATAGTNYYTLLWDTVADARVDRYTVKYTTEAPWNIDATTLWTFFGETQGTSLQIPVEYKGYTFTVISTAKSGKFAPFYNPATDLSWPIITLDLTTILVGGAEAVSLVLSNPTPKLYTDAAGVINSYAGTGTVLTVSLNGVQIPYNATLSQNGSWFLSQVTATNITAGATSIVGNTATIANHSALLAGADFATVVYRVIGKTSTGKYFTLERKQTISKVAYAYQLLAYAVINTALGTFTDNYIIKNGTSRPEAAESLSVWGLNTAWQDTKPADAPNMRLWVSEGMYEPSKNQTKWSPPRWSVLMVDKLSAITADVGTLTAGKLKNASGNVEFSLDNGVIKIFDNNILRVKIGNLDAP